jgi:hypothetical protein
MPTHISTKPFSTSDFLSAACCGRNFSVSLITQKVVSTPGSGCDIFARVEKCSKNTEQKVDLSASVARVYRPPWISVGGPLISAAEAEKPQHVHHGCGEKVYAPQAQNISKASG